MIVYLGEVIPLAANDILTAPGANCLGADTVQSVSLGVAKGIAAVYNLPEGGYWDDTGTIERYHYNNMRLSGGDNVIDEAATRELAEESNFAIDNAVYLGWFYPDNRRTNAKLHVVFSDHVTPNKEKLADDTEFINTIWLSVDGFKNKLMNGEITNYAVLSAWALLITQFPDLSTEERK